MGNKFAEIAFTPKVQDLQEAMGSRKAYSKFEQGRDFNDVLGVHEVEFIAARDSFYMASVSETGWPYVQHRGGPTGFLKVLDASDWHLSRFTNRCRFNRPASSHPQFI